MTKNKDVQKVEVTNTYSMPSSKDTIVRVGFLSTFALVAIFVGASLGFKARTFAIENAINEQTEAIENQTLINFETSGKPFDELSPKAQDIILELNPALDN
jgi:hypothetical protein